VIVPAASVVGGPSPGAATVTVNPAGNTTATVPPGVPAVPKPQAPKLTRVRPDSDGPRGDAARIGDVEGEGERAGLAGGELRSEVDPEQGVGRRPALDPNGWMDAGARNRVAGRPGLDREEGSVIEEAPRLGIGPMVGRDQTTATWTRCFPGSTT